MTVFTAYTNDRRRRVVLVREGFSLAAFVFGPLWLLAHRAWIAGLLVLCAWITIRLVLPDPARLIAQFGLAWAMGVFGQDLRRWSLALRGWRLDHVIAARDDDAALARLVDVHPELAEAALR